MVIKCIAPTTFAPTTFAPTTFAPTTFALLKKVYFCYTFFKSI
jgi:hypothetical protein